MRNACCATEHAAGSIAVALCWLLALLLQRVVAAAAHWPEYQFSQLSNDMMAAVFGMLIDAAASPRVLAIPSSRKCFDTLQLARVGYVKVRAYSSLLENTPMLCAGNATATVGSASTIHC
jgi:hypothetical protein